MGTRRVTVAVPLIFWARLPFLAPSNSPGILTFIVTQNGAVYEKDLGATAATLLANPERRHPDSSWHSVK